jgi:hypothetical protein
VTGIPEIFFETGVKVRTCLNKARRLAAALSGLHCSNRKFDLHARAHTPVAQANQIANQMQTKTHTNIVK